MQHAALDVWPILIGLLGGLAIFLFGLDRLTDMLKATAGARLVDRLIAEDPHRTSTYGVESQLVEHYQRIFYFAKRIARLIAHDRAFDRVQRPVLAT